MVADSVIDALFTPFVPLAIVLLYLFLQVRLIRRGRGPWFALAVVPAVVVAGAAVIAAVGVLDGSNLAPIWLVFAVPPATLWLLLLWLAGALSGSWTVAPARPRQPEHRDGS
jgi:hypothetical protein